MDIDLTDIYLHEILPLIDQKHQHIMNPFLKILFFRVLTGIVQFGIQSSKSYSQGIVSTKLDACKAGWLGSSGGQRRTLHEPEMVSYGHTGISSSYLSGRHTGDEGYSQAASLYSVFWDILVIKATLRRLHFIDIVRILCYYLHQHIDITLINILIIEWTFWLITMNDNHSHTKNQM